MSIVRRLTSSSPARKEADAVQPGKSAGGRRQAWGETKQTSSLVGRLGALIARLPTLGTAGYAPEVVQRLAVMNMMACLIAVSTLGYAVQHIMLDFERFAPVIYINLSLFFVALLVPWSHRFGDMAAGSLILVSEYIALFAFAYFLGRDAGIQLQYFIGMAALCVVFGVRRWRIILPLAIITMGLHTAAWFMFPPETAQIEVGQNEIDGLYFQAAVTTGVLITAIVFYAFSLTEKAKAETDALLRNILPEQVVDRLKSNAARGGSQMGLVADSFRETSILFADISGFVALARKLGAARTVALLNELVCEFDLLAERHGIEKIKTIGDAYMAASGVPEPVSNQALRLVRMGQDMLAVVERIAEEHALPLKMRVGIATGPVMAGIIGSKKFSYDVWGDVVNMAARLEASSLPGRIHICPDTRQRLQGRVATKSNGMISIKGVGERESWFVE